MSVAFEAEYLIFVSTITKFVIAKFIKLIRLKCDI